MKLPRTLLLSCSLVLLVTTAMLGQVIDSRAYLVHVSQGQMTTDSGLDDKTKPEIVEEAALGGKGMKVAFAAGDSVGALAKPTDWSRFTKLRFEAINPGKQVELAFNIVHAKSKNYEGRVVKPIEFKPGKNEIVLSLADLKNVDDSKPDLSSVTRWYLADSDSVAPTLIFGDIVLLTNSAPAAGDAPKSAPGNPAPGKAVAGAVAPGAFKITGTIGGQKVDLIATPLGVTAGSVANSGPAASQASPEAPIAVHGDPNRLKRIHAAKMPAINKPIMFNTPEADAICSALEVYPEDNPFNLVISDWPVHADSKAMIASIGADKPLRYNPDMGFILVPPDQQRVNLQATEYVDESDKGPFPIPPNLPIEGWPVYFQRDGGKPTLEEVQRDKRGEGGDRHAVVVDPLNRVAYEFYQMKKTAAGWSCAQSSIFDLKSNKLRPDTWTSTDAAGLPLFPAIVRYDELQRGSIDHAIRVTIDRSRKDYVYPATHQAGHATDKSLPRMGERIRLRRDFPIKGFSPTTTAILECLKKYGMLVADNGLAWSISVAPDPRIPVLHDELRKVKGSDFEIVTFPPGYEPPVGK